MSHDQCTAVYTYRFRRHVDLDEIQDTLTLSVLGAENLHGRSRVRLDAWYRLDRQRRMCEIDASTRVGEDLNQLFAGFLSKEFGDGAFQVRRGSGSESSGQRAIRSSRARETGGA